MSEKRLTSILCRGCGESVQVPEANQIIQDGVVVWKTICPYCNIKHFHGVF